MHKAPRSIETNQTGINTNLTKVVTKYLNSNSKKPFSEHSLTAINTIKQWLGDWQGELIFDSCCGVGESTVAIALAHPNAKIIGIDKSIARLDKHPAYAAKLTNYLIIRADLNDLWRLAVLEGWHLTKHYLLYPNPYPKSSQLQNRWYASAALPDLLKLGGLLEVRSNWKLYIEEFSFALHLAKVTAEVQQYNAEQAMTPFERKYWGSGQSSWQLIANLKQD
ncbi:tRNA (guanine(46)-N(7))-methyltransferase TrmB [Paraglaciecola hydrolytica]|uniref:tRNA (guanine(46)-N(7))-methyltransferase n=1 Tax=Paraglaciecola hydrolytica TaxID=1799789 RepID=A0A136A390_9ALTE|nr:SAM-dependent methyltransferase [Paraglaciecola hydrolytica]KXI29701.1 SAM-dependent methyltransferase [Paraglaciecola hydrolytica]